VDQYRNAEQSHCSTRKQRSLGRRKFLLPPEMATLAMATLAMATLAMAKPTGPG